MIQKYMNIAISAENYTLGMITLLVYALKKDTVLDNFSKVNAKTTVKHKISVFHLLLAFVLDAHVMCERITPPILFLKYFLSYVMRTYL